MKAFQAGAGLPLIPTIPAKEAQFMKKCQETLFSTEGFVYIYRKIKRLGGELGQVTRNKNGQNVNVTYFLPENSEAENSQAE